MTPTLSTARLSLRPLTKVTNANMAWLRDKEVLQFSEQRHRGHTLSTQLRYVNSFVGRSHLWAIHLIETGDHIGNISAMHDEPNNVSDVGILIGDRRAHRRGYGDEAWGRVCGWLLDGGAIRKLEAGCMRNNVAMVKIIKGNGFTEEGERKNHFLFEGSPISMILFGRVK